MIHQNYYFEPSITFEVQNHLRKYEFANCIVNISNHRKFEFKTRISNGKIV